MIGHAVDAGNAPCQSHVAMFEQCQHALENVSQQYLSNFRLLLIPAIKAVSHIHKS